MLKIAIAGKMGAGKSTTAKFIQHELGGPEKVVIVPQTKDIHQLVRDLNYQDMPHRLAMQDIMEWMRDRFGENCHCSRVAKLIARYNEQGFHGVCDDVRQFNEKALFKDDGFTLIGISTLHNIRAERLKDRDGYDQTPYFNHPKEHTAGQVVPTCDFIIDNNGTLEQLFANVKLVLNSINSVKSYSITK